MITWSSFRWIFLGSPKELDQFTIPTVYGSSCSINSSTLGLTDILIFAHIMEINIDLLYFKFLCAYLNFSAGSTVIIYYLYSFFKNHLLHELILLGWDCSFALWPFSICYVLVDKQLCNCFHVILCLCLSKPERISRNG